MFSSSQLTAEQKTQIHAWAANGAQLADLQKNITESFGIQITYMDTRFVVLDLGVEIIQEQPALESPMPPTQDINMGTGEVVVTLDEIVIPGAMVSGQVTFTDGEKALWALDQMGRFSLDSDTPTYRPSEDDMQDFQEKLRALLQ